MAVGKHCILWSLYRTNRQRPCSYSTMATASIQGAMTMVGQHALFHLPHVCDIKRTASFTTPHSRGQHQ